jgi:carbon monoxide dehydrogenase subunit G
MEVKLDKQYPLDNASVAQAWAVLSDIRATAACMPGAQITEQVDDTHFKGTVKSKVGPAVMVFNGDIEVLGLDPAAMQLQMLGKGADKSGSSASMNLTAHIQGGETPGSSVLVGQAVITVSGKLAQFGSRLLVPVSDAMLQQFAGNFRNAAAAVALPASVDAAAPGDASATADQSAASAAAESATPPVMGPAPVPASAAAATRAQAPAPVAEVKALNPFSLLWIMLKSWLAGLFGKKAG